VVPGDLFLDASTAAPGSIRASTADPGRFRASTAAGFFFWTPRRLIPVRPMPMRPLRIASVQSPLPKFGGGFLPDPVRAAYDACRPLGRPLVLAARLAAAHSASPDTPTSERLVYDTDGCGAARFTKRTGAVRCRVK
jgi:hypothetical protein